METHGRGRDPTAEAPPTDPLPLADEALAGGPAPPAPPCCPCAALLPRLLAAHRMEVRRLLRGALSSLGRRLDSLERKTTRRRKEGGRGGSITCSSSSSPSPPDVTSSCSSSQSEQSRRRKRRRSHEGFAPPGEQQQVEQLRFVGQMAVGGGAEGAEPLVLRDVERRKRRRRGGVGQSEPAARRNGCSSQHALLPVVGRSWTFAAAAAAAAAPPALRLSAVAVETVLGWAMGGACWGPRRPLRDGTAPPGADGDHSYSAAGPPRRGARWSLWLPRRRDPAPDPRSANGLSAADPGDQSGALMEFHSAKKFIGFQHNPHMETHGRGRDPTAEAPPTDPLPLADEALAGGPAPPAPPCCPCAALLPRLLAAHRMEVRRLLRGALSSLGRRLDSLERKTTRRRKEGGRGGSITCSSSSSPSPPDVTSSCSSSQSEQSRRRKRRRSHEGFAPPGEQQQVEQLRFVGQMAVGGGAEGAEPLVLRDVERRKRRRRGGVGQSEPAARRNGCSSQHALLPVVGRSWTFATAAAAAAAPPALRLSAVAVETVLGWAMGGACWGPRRPLRDGTAPPGADGDHSYSAAGPPRRGARWSLWLPRRRDPAPDPRSANGLSAADPGDQSGALMEFHSAKLSKRVSQIRIRRALPRETPLTPMGLPKAKRPKKKEFSLEEIYTNQNYEAPPSVRSLETIFEEPREKDGALLLIGQQKRRRLLLFPDFTQPRRRRRPQGAGLPVSPAPRKRGAVRRHAQGGVMEDGGDVDVMLVERLSELDDFLTRQGLDL